MSDYAEFESKMKKTLENLVSELDAVRAGRANPAVLSQISVDYYGAPTPSRSRPSPCRTPALWSSSRGTAPR